MKPPGELAEELGSPNSEMSQYKPTRQSALRGDELDTQSLTHFLLSSDIVHSKYRTLSLAWVDGTS
ncbi:hypothetical protein J6590_051649 [Homalodisca vitripennis]|nr:hypothetical protein J6590_051649 [Homalodisca vitripennis]